MADTSKVRQRQAYAMGKTPSVGNSGGNPYRAGNASPGSSAQGSSKAPSSGVPCSHNTYAKPKGGK